MGSVRSPRLELLAGFERCRSRGADCSDNAALGAVLDAIGADLEVLDLGFANLGEADDFRALVEHPAMIGVCRLRIANATIGVAGLDALATAPLARLLGLGLAAIHEGDGVERALDDDAFLRLAASGRLTSLDELDLSDNPVGDRGLAAVIGVAPLWYPRSICDRGGRRDDRTARRLGGRVPPRGA